MTSTDLRQRLGTILTQIESELHNGHEATLMDVRWAQFWVLQALFSMDAKLDGVVANRAAEIEPEDEPATEWTILKKKALERVADLVIVGIGWSIFQAVQNGFKLP